MPEDRIMGTSALPQPCLKAFAMSFLTEINISKFMQGFRSPNRIIDKGNIENKILTQKEEP